MNILYINHERHLGGASKCLISIMSSAKNKGNKVYCLTPFSDGEFIRVCKELEIPVICRRFFMNVVKKQKPNVLDYVLIFFLAYFYNFFVALSVVGFVKRNNIDVIHSNSSVINIGCIISSLTNTRSIMHIREYVYEDFNWSFIPNRKKVLGYYNQKSTDVIFISECLEKRLAEYFPDAKVNQIYDGVDIAQVSDENHDLNKIGIVGRIIEGKGQIQAIQAIEILVKKYNRKELMLYIVGSGEKEYIDKLKVYVKEHNLEEHILFVGYKENINEYRKQFGIEMFCSKSEGFGRVVIEAMLCGNIVIASNQGSFPELIDNEKTGFLYSYGDSRKLAEILNDVLSSSNINNIREKARNNALLNYSESKNVASIIELYNTSIVEKR